jgi:CheY-like chemotaxis protein
VNTLVLGETDADLTAFEAALTPLGHPVVTARWGEERLQDRLQSAPGVIVMDVRTPGVGGHETSDLIEQLPLGKDVSVVLLTAAGADVEELTRGYTAKAVEHIAEPIDLEALRSKVATLLEL